MEKGPMLRTSGLELTSAVNSDSSRKVSKGSRSSSRRARRVPAKVSDSSSELVCVNSRSYNMPISKTKKQQGKLLDCNSNDKLEHLPIKKRRHLLRPPSPPPKLPCPVNEENPDFSKSEDDPLQSSVVCPVSCKSGLDAMPAVKEEVQVNHPNKVNGTTKCSDDFSGISMLAAAACSTILGKEFGFAEDGSGIDEPSVHEGPVEVSTNNEAQSLSEGLVTEEGVTTSGNIIGVTSSCITTALAGEFAATSTADGTSEKLENFEKNSKEPFHEDGTPTVSSDVSSIRDEDVVGSRNPQSRDHRLHWDLNVVMDAWDQPLDDQNAQTSDHIYKGNVDVVSCDANRSRGDHNLPNELESSICEVDKKLLHYEPRKSLDQCPEGNTRIPIDDSDHKFQSVSMYDMSVKTECKNDASSLGNANVSAQPSLCKYVNETLPVLKHADNEHTGESMNHDVTTLFTDQSNLPVPPVSDRTSAAATENTSVSVIDTQVRLTCRPNLDNDNELTLKSMMSDKPFDYRRQSLKDVENCAEIYKTTFGKIKKEDYHPQSPSYLQNFTVTSGTKENNDKFFLSGCEQVEVDFHISTKEVKMASDEHFEEKFVSDTAADPCSHETDTARKLQDDNDSQYEDGELREPGGHLWEEYDAVNEKTEHVDSVFENRRRSLSTADHHDSELGLIKRIKQMDTGNVDLISSASAVANEHGPEFHRPIADDNGYRKDGNLLKLVYSGEEKMKAPLSNEMLESNKMSSTAVVRVRDGGEGKGRIYNLATRPPDPDGTNTMFGSRIYGRGMLSQIEAPAHREMPFREDQTVNRSKLDGVAARWERGSSYMKSTESVRYSMQSQPRAHPGKSWHGSSDVRRGIKHNYSPTYNAHVKPDDGDDTVAKEGRDGTLNTASYINHPRPIDESISEVGAAGNFQPNHRLNGGLGSDRPTNRGRFFGYGRQMDHGAAGRGKYHGPSPDDNSFHSSPKYRRPISQRDRSFSPNERSRSPDPRVFSRVRSAADPRDSPRGRTDDNSFQSSPKYRRPISQRDRSFSPNERSRSPDPRVFSRVRSAADPRDSPRGRTAAGDCGGPYVRHRNLSPNFRSEARMPRMRSPPNHQRFGFRALQRDQGSPPSTRWISNKKDEVGHVPYKQRSMRDESPNRIRMRSDRTDHVEFARNPKPDVCFRQNTGRFNEMDANSRPQRLEENFENRRRQFGPANNARRGYEDGIAKRLHHGDDGFVSMNRNVAEFQDRGNRDIDNQNGDNPRKFRRDATFMYERDGKFSSNSKHFGFGNSAEPYRSGNPRRFHEMNGAGRGQSYDERRRPFGNVYLPRRGEMEGGIGRRLSHDIDDDLPVPQSSCNDDDVIDSHGRNPRGDDMPTRQREEEQLDLCEQEKEVGEISKSTDVVVAVNSPSSAL